MLKTHEFRTKDFFVRSTHSIERVGRQILSSLEGAIQKKMCNFAIGLSA